MSKNTNLGRKLTPRTKMPHDVLSSPKIIPPEHEVVDVRDQE